MSTETVTQAPDAKPEGASRWEDFIDVFLSPTELFRRRANDSWLVPFFVLAGLMLILQFAFLPVNRVIWETALASNTQITAEQQAAAQKMAGTMQIVGGLVAPIVMAVFLLLGGFIAWIAGKITSIDLPFKRALTITTYVSFLAILQQLVTYVMYSLKLRSGGELDQVKDASFGIVRFLQPAEMNQFVVALLGRIDVFAFWQTGWMAIAFMVAANAPKGAAWTTAAIVWIVGALPMLLKAMFT